ncbi:MAG: VWA domain-containing protein, partial [Acidobacteriota bacterium]
MRFRLTVIFLLGAAAAFAQTRETINVSVVEVPVTVVDRSGNPVRGLKAYNFEIYDGGQKRAITSFDSIDFASAESVKSVSPMNPSARRTFMILFDMTFSRPGSITRAQEAARNFLAHGLQRRDLVSVGTLDADRGFRLLTNFTTDRSMVASAIADPRSFKSSDPLQIASDPQIAVDTTPTSPTGGGGRFGAEDEAKAMAAVSASNDDRFKRQRIDRQLAGLATLAKTLRAVPGRKQILFLSEGFDPRLVQGRGAGEHVDQAAENEAVLRGQVWNVDTDNRYGSSESQSNIERMAQFFRRSDVVLNAVDIQGVRVQNDSQKGSIVNSNEGLSLLALPTGGTVFKNSNDISGDLDRVLKQQEVVYVLAFQAPSATPGKAHDLKVKLVDVAGGARATYRSAYYEAGGESAVERTLTNAEIVLNDIPTSDVHLSVLAAPFPTGASSAQVPVIVEIDGSDLTRLGRNNTATVEMYIYAFDEQGVVRDSLFQKITLDLAKVGESLKASGVKYYGTLSLNAGSYAIKTLVRVAESDRKGYARS